MTVDQFEEVREYDSGSCRDLTFGDISADKAKKAISWLGSVYDKMTVIAVKSDDSLTIDPKDYFNDSYQYMHIHAESEVAPVRQIQFFIAENEDGSFFIELTFFPEHISNEPNSRDMFVKWLTRMEELVDPNEYYLRFGNASWEFGDITNGSGVIYYKRFG